MSEDKEKSLQFLALGTMVDVEDMDAALDTKYVVVARAVGKNTSGQTILRYRLAPHPAGNTPANQADLLTVEGSKITKIYSEGYRDEKDDIFLEQMLAQMTGDLKKMKTEVKAPPVKSTEQAKATSPLPEEKQSSKEKEEERLRQDPFYKFRKKEVK